MKPLVILLLAACVLVAAPTGAGAADEDPEKVEQARKYFDAGRQAYESGQYLVSIAAFEEAMKLSPRPPVIFSLAQAYRRQYFVDRDPGKLKRALDLYKQYVVEVPQGGRRDDAVQYIAELEPVWLRVEEEQKKSGKSMEMQPVRAADSTQLMISSRTKGATASLDGGQPAELPMIREVKAGPHKVRVEAEGYFPEEVEGVAVEGRLVPVEVNLRPMPAKVAVRAPDGADITVDGRPAGTTPLGRPLELAAGKHLITVSKRGHHPVMKEITVKRGQALTVEARLDKTTQRKVSYWVLGAAGACLIGGGVTTGLAMSHQGNAEAVLDAMGQGPITQADLDEYEREREARDDMKRASTFLYGGAAALAATGLLLYFIDSPRIEAPPGAGGAGGTIVPAASADYLGVSFTGWF